MDFSEQLVAIMQELNMRDADLHRETGVSKQNIGKLKAGSNTTPETVKKVAEALNWDVDDALLAAGFAPLNVEALRKMHAAGIEDLVDALQGYKQLPPASKQYLKDVIRRTLDFLLDVRSEAVAVGDMYTIIPSGETNGHANAEDHAEIEREQRKLRPRK